MSGGDGILGAGINSYELIFFEYMGGATLELVVRDPANPGIGILATTGDPVVDVPLPGTLSLLGVGLVALRVRFGRS